MHHASVSSSSGIRTERSAVGSHCPSTLNATATRSAPPLPPPPVVHEPSREVRGKRVGSESRVSRRRMNHQSITSKYLLQQGVTWCTSQPGNSTTSPSRTT